MNKKIRITEEQYRQALSEGVTLNADVSAANGDIKQAVKKTKQEAQKSGMNMNDANIQIKASDTNESKVISKKELMANRMKVLKEHSEIVSLKEFINKR